MTTERVCPYLVHFHDAEACCEKLYEVNFSQQFNKFIILNITAESLTMSASNTIWSASNLSAWNDGDEDDENPFKSEENERDCTLFVIDCNESMFESQQFDAVCAAVAASLKRKIVKSAADLVGLVLFNVLSSRNAMKLDFIHLLFEPDCPSAALIKKVRDLPATFRSTFKVLGGGKQCDFRDLLWAQQTMFSEVDVKGTKYGSKRSFIFTNNDRPEFKDRTATIAKSQDMLEAGIEINVFPLAPNFDFNAFYKVEPVHSLTLSLSERKDLCTMHTQTRSVETLRGSMFKEVTFQHLSGKTRF